MSNTVTKDDYDLKKAWDDACDAFAKTTSEDLRKSPKFSPDEVLQQIRAKQEGDEERNAKYQVAKNVLSKTLDCVDNLGNVVAQGASMVFGPSGMCMNAISFLIATGAKYRNIFSSLTELFSRITDFLERFKIYFRMPNVDIALRKIINDLLICFVSICALSIKVLQGNKALLYLKVLAFSGDAGVAAKLNELAALAEREQQMRGTLGYEVEKDIERNVVAGRTETKEGIRALNSAVNEMAELEKTREANSIQTKQLEAIKKALDSPSESYRAIYKNFIDKKVEGTGVWLQEDHLYSEWAWRNQSSSSILCLAGGEGYGKSFLMSIVVQDLKKRYPQGGDNLGRTSIAYYYFQREAKGPQSGEKDALSLSNALKSLAWQISNLDAVYRKELHASCTSIEDVEDITDLWAKLFAGVYKSDNVFYLLLDGIDQMEEKHLKALSQVLHQIQHKAKETEDRGLIRLRIMFSGRNETIERLKKNIDDEISIIDLATNNKDDIEKFVRDGIANIDILSGTSPQVQTLRDEIFMGLTRDDQRDFINVDLLLKQIADKQRPADIREVLQRFQDGENRSDTIARVIEGLNNTLGQQDITDLNELLTWVICAFRPLTLEELEAVLFMKNGEGGSSLQSLSDSIRERYSKIFTVDGEPDPETKKTALTATVSIISDSIEGYFRAASAAQDNEVTNNSISSGEVNESEVKIVRRFLTSVCEPELFKKFQFEQFFQNKLSTSTAVIKVDLEAAHLKIVADCLEVIYSDHTKALEPLLNYAMWFFSNHLSQIDLSLTLPQRKTDIGARLLGLFVDEKIIARWWTNENQEMRWDWLYTDDFADVVLNWFKDSAVVKGLREEDKQWVKDLTSNSKPSTDLLENIAKFLAGKWLRDSTWDLNSLILFVHGFLTKIGSRRDHENIARRTDDFPLSDVTISNIHEMLDWAKKNASSSQELPSQTIMGQFPHALLGIDRLGYDETRNIARTYRECQKHKESIEKFKEASNMEEDNWLCLWGLSVAYGGQHEWDLAISTLEGVVESIRSGKAKSNGPKEELREMNREIAQYNREAGNFDAAAKIYEAILEESPDDYDTAFEFMALLRKNKSFAKMLTFIQKMKLSIDEKTGLDRWTKFYHEFAQYSEYHETIVAAVSEEEGFALVKNGYEMALEAAKAKQKAASSRMDHAVVENTKSITAMLLYYFATFIYVTCPDDDAKKLAISLWEQVLQLEKPSMAQSNYLPWAQCLVRRKLPRVYIEQARAAGPDSDVAKDFIERARQIGVDDELSEWAGDSHTAQALGRYFSSIERKEETKDALRHEIKLNLDLLSDDDPSNDWQGYLGLSQSLVFAGQDENALAAWSLITPYETEEESHEPNGDDDLAIKASEETHGNSSQQQTLTADSISSPDVADEPPAKNNKVESTNRTSILEPGPKTSDTNTPPSPKIPELKGPLTSFCDGRCGTTWSYANDFWMCRDCRDALFDKDCLKLLKEDKLEHNVCDKNHEHFHVPKYDEKATKEIGQGNVKVGDTVIAVGEWLERLKKDWGLASEEVAENSAANGTEDK